MTFKDEYNTIKKLVEDDLFFVEEGIEQIFSAGNAQDSVISSELFDFLTAPSKRLRPLLGFLFLRCVNSGSKASAVNVKQKNILLAVELIHNATLIHDDVIDEATKRRDKVTINSKFSNDLAVVSGDFLLSVALEKVIETESIDVLKLFTSSLKQVCLGEFSQYFSKFNLMSIEDYVQKSKEKTALLFMTGILGSLMLNEQKPDAGLFKLAEDFAENFGIAFQIRDDLLNVLNSDNLKPCFNDLTQGVYTAPVIFAYPDGKVAKKDEILEKIKSTGSIEKTKSLMDNYFNKAVYAIDSCSESPYKSALINLVTLLKNNI